MKGAGMATPDSGGGVEVLDAHYAIQINDGGWRTVISAIVADPGETAEQTAAWCLADIRKRNPKQTFRVVEVVTQQRVIDDSYLHARSGRKGA